ncbi:MAG: DUF4336 domain-containing protein [Rhizobiaceae bacterium]
MTASVERQCLKPYEPVNRLKSVADGLAIVDGPEIHMDYLAGLYIPFTTRMTVVTLADGGLWVHSPIPLTDALKREIDALGPVRHLVAPNRIHFWWVGDWKEAYPDARAHAAPGTAAQARKKGRFHDYHTMLGDAPEPEWAGEIDQLALAGSFMTEIVFFHRKSRTLILTDMIENFEPDRVDCRWLRPLLSLGGVADPHGSMPRDLRLTFLFRRRRLREAVHTMIGWAPQRIVLAHGRWYRENGTEELRRAFRWIV